MNRFTKMYLTLAVVDLILEIMCFSTIPFLAVKVGIEYVNINEEINDLKNYHANIQSKITAENTEIPMMQDYDRLLNQIYVLIEDKASQKVIVPILLGFDETFCAIGELEEVIAEVAVLAFYLMLMMYSANKLISYILEDKCEFSICSASCFYWIATNAVSLGFISIIFFLDWNSFRILIGYIESTGLYQFFKFYLIALRVVFMLFVSLCTIFFFQPTASTES